VGTVAIPIVGTLKKASGRYGWFHRGADVLLGAGLAVPGDVHLRRRRQRLVLGDDPVPAGGGQQLVRVPQGTLRRAANNIA
jgi:hypothetical protein